MKNTLLTIVGAAAIVLLYGYRRLVGLDVSAREQLLFHTTYKWSE